MIFKGIIRKILVLGLKVLMRILVILSEEDNISPGSI